MKQNLSISTRDLARLKRQSVTGHNQYSPIFIGDHAIAIAKFMAENEVPADTLEMALAETADDSSLPLFYVRHDDRFTRFHVTPGNMLAAAYLMSPQTLSEDGLAGLFQYCGR